MASQTSSLHLAIAYGDAEIVDVLAKCMDVNEREPRLRRTPLHIAVKWDNFAIVRILLENGARVNDVSDDNLTALHIAVANRSSAMVALLLENGADVDPEVKFCGKTPLYMAVDYNCPRIVDMLLRAGASIKKAETPKSSLFDVAEKIGATLLRNMLLRFERKTSARTTFERSVSKEEMLKIKLITLKRHLENRDAFYIALFKKNLRAMIKSAMKQI